MVDYDEVNIKDAQGSTKMNLKSGRIRAGGNGTGGSFICLPPNVQNSVDDEVKATVFLNSDGYLQLGAFGKNGRLYLYPSSAQHTTPFNAPKNSTMILDGDGGNIWLGGNGADGDLVIFPSNADNILDTSKATLHFDGDLGKLWLGGNGKDGEIVIFPTAATNNHDNNQATILMDGGTGNISTKGDLFLMHQDCAEEFDLKSGLSDVEAGTVMVIDTDGLLQISKREYDKRVAGVVSGAGEYKPGIILGKKDSHNDRIPLALMGKVNCKVDADYSQIRVGDMLTSSNTPGYAMKANNRRKSFGTVIGKALRSLKSGKGLIPILIALQ